MRVVEPTAFKGLRHRSPLNHWRLFAISLALIVLSSVYTLYAVSRLPQIIIKTGTVTYKPQAYALSWPTYGQSAIGAVDYGVLATHNTEQPVPMASVAKVITALAVLKKFPLSLNQNGPTLTLNDADVAIYQNYAAQGGSVVRVVAGEQITEYQALEAMLLPSANNMADSLAIWAFGSIDAYTSYTNTMIRQLGLTKTIVAGASGFSSQAVGTADDLVKLGLALLQQPVLAQIVSEKQASIPVVGAIKNYNSLLGQNGIIGIKTGNTDQAGGCYLFAAIHNYANNNTVTIVGAIMGAPTLEKAMGDATALLTNAAGGFGNITVARAGQIVGRYGFNSTTNTSPALIRDNLQVFGWIDTKYEANVTLHALESVSQTKNIGIITVAGHTQSQPIDLGKPLVAPSLWWRVLHRRS